MPAAQRSRQPWPRRSAEGRRTPRREYGSRIRSTAPQVPTKIGATPPTVVVNSALLASGGPPVGAASALLDMTMLAGGIFFGQTIPLRNRGVGDQRIVHEIEDFRTNQQLALRPARRPRWRS